MNWGLSGVSDVYAGDHLFSDWGADTPAHILATKIFSYAEEFLMPTRMSEKYLNGLKGVVANNSAAIAAAMTGYVPQDVAAKTFSENAGPSKMAAYFHYLLQVAADRLKWARPANDSVARQTAQYVYAKLAKNQDYPGIPASLASQLPPELQFTEPPAQNTPPAGDSGNSGNSGGADTPSGGAGAGAGAGRTGTGLTTGTGNPGYTPPKKSAATPKQEDDNTVLYIGIGVGVLALAGIGLLVWKKRKNKQAAEAKNNPALRYPNFGRIA